MALYKKDSKPFKQLQYYIIFFVFLFIFFRQDHKVSPPSATFWTL